MESTPQRLEKDQLSLLTQIYAELFPKLDLAFLNRFGPDAVQITLDRYLEIAQKQENPTKAKHYLQAMAEKPANNGLRKLQSAASDKLTNAAIEKNLKPVDYVLIANRGEIAYRMIQEAHAKGKAVIILREEGDPSWKDFLHEEVGDEDREFVIPKYCDRGKPLDEREDVKAIKEITAKLRVWGIYPENIAAFSGYGFNSEDAPWIRTLEKLGYRICGPGSKQIEDVGVKTSANGSAAEAGLNPPSSSGKIMCGPTTKKNPEEVERQKMIALNFYRANPEIDTFLFKDSRGGGGSGQYKFFNTKNEADFQKALDTFYARSEIVEFSVDEFIEGTRHIEFQVIGDMDGNVRVMGYRDCSEQVPGERQKIIEECSRQIPESEREEFARSIVDFFHKLKEKNGGPYVGLATVETMYRPDEPEGRRFRFLEVNPRPQVELPVTELQSGHNLIGSLIDVADGKKLKEEKEIANRDIDGHTIEARITMQKPMDQKTIDMFSKMGVDKVLQIAEGTVTRISIPDLAGVWIQVDPRIKPGTKISNKYDPMVMKIVAHVETRAGETPQQTRTRAIDQLTEAVRELKIEGTGSLQTNRQIVLEILDDYVFRERNHRSPTSAPRIFARMRGLGLMQKIKEKFVDKENPEAPIDLEKNETIPCTLKFKHFNKHHRNTLITILRRLAKEGLIRMPDLALETFDPKFGSQMAIRQAVEEIFAGKEEIVQFELVKHKYSELLIKLIVESLGMRPEEVIQSQKVAQPTETA
ncbi:MAG: biotin carboxylase N-terminal domain-containing protein [Patescibacteria group bacterium]